MIDIDALCWAVLEGDHPDITPSMRLDAFEELVAAGVIQVVPCGLCETLALMSDEQIKRDLFFAVEHPMVSGATWEERTAILEERAQLVREHTFDELVLLHLPHTIDLGWPHECDVVARLLSGFEGRDASYLSHPRTTSVLSCLFGDEPPQEAAGARPFDPRAFLRAVIESDDQAVRIPDRFRAARLLRKFGVACTCYPGDASTATRASLREWLEESIVWPAHDDEEIASRAGAAVCADPGIEAKPGTLKCVFDEWRAMQPGAPPAELYAELKTRSSDSSRRLVAQT